jgi:hypothetical protein
MADDTILETKGLTKEFKGFVAVKDVNLSIRPRHYSCAHRAQRRRQDHMFQPPHAFPDPDAGPDILQWQGNHRFTAGGHRAHGPGALVPDFCGVSEPVRT